MWKNIGTTDYFVDLDFPNCSPFSLVKEMFAKFVKPRFNISAAEVKRLAEEFVRIEQENDD